MRKQIDPNLSGSADELLFMGAQEAPLAESHESTEPFKIQESEADEASSSGDFSADGQHHHHSSSGSHSHHHSSGSSHGSHHHSRHHHRRHHHRHHHHHHHHSKRRIPVWARVLIIIFAILFAAVAIIGGTYLGLREKGQNDLVVEQANPKYEETVEYNGHTYIYDKNKVAFAFIGVDSEKVGKNDGLIGTSGQADTDMVAVVDTATGKVSIITVPRDTMVDIDLYSTDGKFLRTENMQVCLSYAYGDGAESSCKNTTTALSRILANVPIEKYFVLDLKGIAPLNDAIGGVTVESLYDFPDQNIKKGDKVTIMGDFAETYVRKRDTNTINASLNRTARQSQYIKAYAEQLRKAVTSDFSTISNLYNTASKYSQTNISLSDVTYLASVVLQHGVTEVNQYMIDGEMKASSEVSEDVFAEYYADSDSVMEIVLNCFYQQVS